MSGGRGPVDGAIPYFFLSYAHSHTATRTDEYRRNRLVKRFHDDLKDALREAAGGSATSAIDFDIPVGSRWSEYISDGLARCRCFVALYSTDYFASDHCGREWRAFADRLDTDLVLRGRRPEAVIPVLWQPFSESALPDCARELQYSHYKLGHSYRRHGLAYLLRHRAELHEDYENAVQYFARRIADVAESDSPTRAERFPNYLMLDNAFQGEQETASNRARLRIVIAAPSTPHLPQGADPDRYGSRSMMWKPYHPAFGGEISAVAQRVAASMGFDAFVEAFEHSGEFGAAARPSAPTLLIIDPWAVQDPQLRQRLGRFDADSHNKPWIRPVVPWNREHPSDEQHAAELGSRLAALLGRCRLRYRPESPRVLDGLETIHDFINEVPALIRTAERLYFRELAAQRAQSARPFGPPHRRLLLGVAEPAPGMPEPHDGLDTVDGHDQPPRPTGLQPVKAFLQRQRHLEIPNTEGPA